MAIVISVTMAASAQAKTHHKYPPGVIYMDGGGSNAAWMIVFRQNVKPREMDHVMRNNCLLGGAQAVINQPQYSRIIVFC